MTKLNIKPIEEAFADCIENIRCSRMEDLTVMYGTVDLPKNLKEMFVNCGNYASVTMEPMKKYKGVFEFIFTDDDLEHYYYVPKPSIH